MIYVRMLQDWPSKDHPILIAGTVERFDPRRAKILIDAGKAEKWEEEQPTVVAPPAHKQIKRSRYK